MPQVYPATISILSQHALTRATVVRQRVLDPWVTRLPQLAPTHLQRGEPVRQALDLANDAVLEGPWIALRRNPRVTAVFWPGTDQRHASLTMSLQAPHAGALDLADCLVRSMDPIFAMAHVLVDSERDAYEDPKRPDIAFRNLRTREAVAWWGFDAEIGHGLPTLYWRTYFGPPYIGLIGRRRLLESPVHAVRDLGNLIELTLTDRPPSDATWMQWESVRQQAIEHLGRDLFWPSPRRVPELPGPLGS